MFIYDTAMIMLVSGPMDILISFLPVLACLIMLPCSLPLIKWIILQIFPGLSPVCSRK